jgi:hypothetical protein
MTTPQGFLGTRLLLYRCLQCALCLNEISRCQDSQVFAKCRLGDSKLVTNRASAYPVLDQVTVDLWREVSLGIPQPFQNLLASNECGQGQRIANAARETSRFEQVSLGKSRAQPARAGPLLLGLPPLRQIFLGQWRSGRLALHHDARNSPAASFFDRLNAVDAACDLLAVAVQRVAAP